MSNGKTMAKQRTHNCHICEDWERGVSTLPYAKGWGLRDSLRGKAWSSLVSVLGFNPPALLPFSCPEALS